MKPFDTSNQSQAQRNYRYEIKLSALVQLNKMPDRIAAIKGRNRATEYGLAIALIGELDFNSECTDNKPKYGLFGL